MLDLRTLGIQSYLTSECDWRQCYVGARRVQIPSEEVLGFLGEDTLINKAGITIKSHSFTSSAGQDMFENISHASKSLELIARLVELLILFPHEVLLSELLRGRKMKGHAAEQITLEYYN